MTISLNKKKAPPCIFEKTLEELQNEFKIAGFDAFRAKQVLQWLYKKRVQCWDGMQNIPSALKLWLQANYVLMPNEVILTKGTKDATQKYLLKLYDGALIETVLIQAPKEDTEDTNFGRKTVCISTQVGCAYGCKFCASGLAGWKRDLTAGEIVAQLLRVCWLIDQQSQQDHAPFDNIVVMGMGEPLANYNNLVKAINILNASWGLAFGARRITVSTSGLAPRIIQLADEPIQFRLAISLHGATNEVRQQIMPVNRRYPLEELIPAAKIFAQKHKRMITLEFILIEKVNDSIDQAEALAKIALDLHAHVNLIPYNTVEGLHWKRPSIQRQQAFMRVLKNYDISATIRREKGHAIDAACGQLRLQNMDSTGTSSPINP